MEKVCLENRKIIQKYDSENKRNSLSEKTRGNNIQFLILIAKTLQKPFKKITRKDINSYLNSLDVSNGTRANYTIQLRKFFKWLYNDENPNCIKDLKVVKVKDNKLKYSDMLSEDEIQKLIDTYQDPQHKALISVLYDSACRVGELIGLKRGDVVCNNGQWVISVNGKTGVRNIPLTLSVVYLEPWFNRYHPTKDNKQAPLFISMSPRDMYKKIEERHLSVVAVWFMLDHARRASRIGKEVHPHLLRHSRLTWLSDHGMSENMMRIYAGWTNGSDMPAVYLHTNPANIAIKLNQIQGNAPPEESKPEPSKLLPKKCPRCQAENDASSPYCKQCWLPLNIKVSLAETMMIDLIRSTWYEVVKAEYTKLGIQVEPEKLAETFAEYRSNVSKVKNELPEGVKKVALQLLEQHK